MQKKRKPPKAAKRRPGPAEERLVIWEDPALALKKLFKPKPAERQPPPKKRK